MHPQIPLPLATVPSTSFNTYFIASDNQAVLSMLQGFAASTLPDSQLFLWGEPHSGKTHLLSAVCNAAAQDGYRVAYLPAEYIEKPGALEGLEHCDLVCFDDVDAINAAAEIELFHCINRCRDNSVRLLFAASGQPDSLDLSLPDLRTRLTWGPVFQIHAVPEDQLQAALLHQLESRSLKVSNDVAVYLLNRFPRNISSLKQIIDLLDHASLKEQRRVTVPLIKQLIDEKVIDQPV
jgi:DnaA family protein